MNKGYFPKMIEEIGQGLLLAAVADVVMVAAVAVIVVMFVVMFVVMVL